MKILWRVVRVSLVSLVGLVALAGALFAYFLYTPEPAPLAAPGILSKGTITVAGVPRTYLRYVPRNLKPGAPLLLVMHGSGEGAAEVRVGTGNAFERLAEAQGFAIVYPESLTFDWNDCSIAGDYRVKGVPVDDLAYLRALTAQVLRETGASAQLVFASGVSAGGSMALRVALEAPETFRAAAAVSANVPTPGNFKCKPAGQGMPVLIMNGTRDPLVPFDGGEINLWGMFYKAGTVLSSRASAAYLAQGDKDGAAPATATAVSGGVRIDTMSWQGALRPVSLVAIEGGGHGLPQPYYRRPRLLGPSPMAPDGAAIIWDFFLRSAE